MWRKRLDCRRAAGPRAVTRRYALTKAAQGCAELVPEAVAPACFHARKGRWAAAHARWRSARQSKASTRRQATLGAAKRKRTCLVVGTSNLFAAEPSPRPEESPFEAFSTASSCCSRRIVVSASRARDSAASRRVLMQQSCSAGKAQAKFGDGQSRRRQNWRRAEARGAHGSGSAGGGPLPGVDKEGGFAPVVR